MPWVGTALWVWAAHAAWAVEPVPVVLTLDAALDRLAAEAPDGAIARARVDVANGIARQVAAAWRPVLVAQGSVTRNDNEVVLSFGDLLSQLPVPPIDGPQDVVIQPLEVFNVAGTLRVPLFAPTAWAESTAAARGATAAEAAYAEVWLQLQAGLVVAAASTEAADGVVAAARRAVEVAEAHRRATEVAQVAGTATAVDVLAAKADLARRRSEAVQAEAALASAQEALGGLLGIDGPVSVLLPDTPAPQDPVELARPALVAAEAQVDAAHARVQAAWWRQAPTVTATATGLLATVPFPTGNEWAYKLGLEATWTLYDGGFRYGRLRQANAELASATATRTAEDLRLSRQSRDAERDLRVAGEQLQLAREQSALASEAAEVAQRGLAAGTVSPLQARDTENQAFAADVAVAGARARLRIAEAGLRRARGLDQRW